MFTCSGGRTGSIESCWGRSNEKGITQCDGGALNNSPMTVCTVVNNRYSFGRTCKQGGADYIVNSLGLNGSGYPCSCN